MHLVLRSTLAKGAWSFVQPKNRHMIMRVLAKHAQRTGTELLGTGNAGNHLHLRAKFTSRKQYCSFIRSVAGEIARIGKNSTGNIPISNAQQNKSFWDQRPFSSIVSTLRYVARISDYIKINELEGLGYARAIARLVVQKWRDGT